MSDETADQKVWNSADRERVRAVCDRLKAEGTEREATLAGDLVLALDMIRTLEWRVSGMTRARNTETRSKEQWRERAEKAERERDALRDAMRKIIDTASSDKPEGHSPYDTINGMADKARRALKRPEPAATTDRISNEEVTDER